MSKKNIVIEVGMNDGKDTRQLLLKYGHEWGDGHPTPVDCALYGFEPTPRLASYLLDQFKSDSRVHISPIPISNHPCPTLVDFHIAGQADWGCSSLNKFSPDIEQQWPGRPDFKVTQTIQVMTYRLYDFIAHTHPLNEDVANHGIAYLHIDAQGSDYDVIRSLDNQDHPNSGHDSYLECVRAGRCEVANYVHLYENTPNNHIDVVKPFLESRGFHVDVLLDAAGGKEANLDFFRR